LLQEEVARRHHPGPPALVTGQCLPSCF
jgi:hypothetical protein